MKPAIRMGLLGKLPDSPTPTPMKAATRKPKLMRRKVRLDARVLDRAKATL